MKRYTFFFICILFKMNAFAQEFKIDGGQLVLPAPIVFETGSDKIKAESEQTLEYIKKFLQAKEYITLLRIEGHTNNVGNEQKNQELSEKRAMAIAKNLVAKGIDCKRLIAVGFGSSKPIAQNSTPEGRAQNVRYEMRMAALRGALSAECLLMAAEKSQVIRVSNDKTIDRKYGSVENDTFFLP